MGLSFSNIVEYSPLSSISSEDLSEVKRYFTSILSKYLNIFSGFVFNG